MTNLIRWQTHRYVLRQSLTYFANDFAGRIASNIVQSAASLRDSTVQVIDALVVRDRLLASALAILAEADWRLTLPLAGWIVVYVATLAASCRASAGAPRFWRIAAPLLTGRIVDSYTNIQAVKLFAHLDREDEHAREALDAHTKDFHSQTRLITLMNLCVSSSNGALVVATGAVSICFGHWAHVAGADRHRRWSRIRITTMSGWVMWTAIGVFDNVGQVQEGMRTIARPQTLVDADARPNSRPTRAKIRFEKVHSTTARRAA